MGEKRSKTCRNVEDRGAQLALPGEELVFFPGKNRTCEPPGNVSQCEATEKASCTQGPGRRMFKHESSRSSKGHRDESGGQRVTVC